MRLSSFLLCLVVAPRRDTVATDTSCTKVVATNCRMLLGIPNSMYRANSACAWLRSRWIFFYFRV